MTPREAGIQAFYADEGTTNTLQGLNAAFDAYEAAAREPVTGRCTMGIGCVETGVCYATANGQPDRCMAISKAKEA